MVEIINSPDINMVSNLIYLLRICWKEDLIDDVIFCSLNAKRVKNTHLPPIACDDMLVWLLINDERYFVKKTY